MRTVAGRVLGLMMVGLLVMSAAGLAASQTFINKTGKTVTGITIEFSRSVTITRHDSAFPDQSPSGRSDEFTFSGRDLRNLGRFNISWMPSSAKVMDYEWIEKAQPTQATQGASPSSEQEFSLPDPNTPAILYGDDYPGPDEPLYQPKEDEQIWLTDLEGHGDSYDNDSIKINYAPGFDASQITKIEVYRNGIKLRFLPQKIDVLTNAQMKTFDGNPAERSPASNHTDHAIMGYEYKFKILSADHVWILKKTVKSGFRWRPKEVWAEMGISWDWNQIDGLALDKVIRFLQYLKNDGFTGISIDIPSYVNTPYDSDVFNLYDTNSDIATRGGIVTPTTAELQKMLQSAEKASMDVHIRGHLYISQKYKEKHGDAWSSLIDPKNPGIFFDGYTILWMDLMPMFNQYKVKLITLFTEMDGIEKYSDLIERMYSKLSEAFTGELGFEEATNLMLYEDSPMQHGRTFMQMVKNFTFWNWTDLRGMPMRIEYSGWSAPAETQKDQRVSVMTPNIVEFWKPAVNYYSSTYSQNPQMFGEFGAYNADGQSLGFKYYDIPVSRRVMDEQERSDYILAALRGAKDLDVIRAINVWGDFDNGDFAPRLGCASISTGHYSYPASPMYRTIKAIIKPAE